MKARPGKVWDRAHDASRRALLAAEEQLRRDMADTLRTCRERHLDVDDLDTQAIRVSADLLFALPAVILRGRMKARQASASSLAGQLAVAVRLGARGLPAVLPAMTTSMDEERARAAARSYAAAWLRSALEAIDARRDRGAGPARPG